MKKIVTQGILLFISSYFLILVNVNAQSVRFDRDNNNGIHSKSSSALNLTTQGTVEAWFYLDNYDNFAGIVHKGDRKDFSDEAYTLQLWNNNKLYFALVNGANEVSLQTSSSLSTGRWYHVAACWNQSGIDLYLNGQLENTTSSSLTLSYSNLSDTTRNGLNIGMQLNEDYDKTYKKLSLSGYVDEVRIWNTKLSAYQVQKRMFEEITSSDSLWNNLIGYFKMNEGTGKMVYDIKNNSNPGIFIPNTTKRPVWYSTAFPKEITWTGTSSDDWDNENNWDIKIKPHGFAKVNIPSSASNYPKIQNSNSKAKDMNIESGACLRVSSNKTLNVNGDLILKAGNNKTAAILDEGNVSVTGNIIIERIITANGWHYVSSPVANANSNYFWGSALYYYNEPTSEWVKVTNNQTLTTMKGYDTYIKTNNKTINLQGNLNKGNYSISLTAAKDGYNLVGNPYPCTIDWDAASGWTKTNITGAIYIWDPAINNYMSYSNGAGTNGGSRYIPATQGFFVKANAGGGSLAINNNARVSTMSVNHRSTASNVLSLKVLNENYSDETIIRFNSNASFEFDDQYDADKLLSFDLNVPQIFTVNSDQRNYSINTIPELVNSYSVNLSLIANITGNYQISPDFLNMDPGIEVFLEDKFNGNIHNLRQGNYLFTSTNTDNPDRFVLHFIQSKKITDLSENADNQIRIFNSSHHLYLIFPENKMEAENVTVNIFDMLGKNVYSRKLNNPYGQMIIEVPLLHGNYIVQLMTSGQTINKNLSF